MIIILSVIGALGVYYFTLKIKPETAQLIRLIDNSPDLCAQSSCYFSTPNGGKIWTANGLFSMAPYQGETSNVWNVREKIAVRRAIRLCGLKQLIKK